jgi:Fic family protein
MNNTTERTATRDLLDLVEKGVIKSSGIKGAGAYYTLTNNNAIITPQ